MSHERKVSARQTLLVSSDATMLEIYGDLLKSKAHEIIRSQTAKESLKVLIRRPTGWEAIVVDQKLPDLSGLSLIKTIRRMCYGARTIILLGGGPSLEADHVVPANTLGLAKFMEIIGR